MHRAQLIEKQLEIYCLKGSIAELKIGDKTTKEKAAKLYKILMRQLERDEKESCRQEMAHNKANEQDARKIEK